MCGALPEGDGRYSAHECVGSDALQVEQGPVEQQEEDDVLAEAEAPPTLPDDRDVLEVCRTTFNLQPLDLKRLLVTQWPRALYKSGYRYLTACKSPLQLPVLFP